MSTATDSPIEPPTLSVPLSSTPAWARLTDANLAPNGLRARILKLPLGSSALKLVDRATALFEELVDKGSSRSRRSPERGEKRGILADLSLRAGRRVARRAARLALHRILSPKQRTFLERHSSLAASVLAKPGAEPAT